MVFSKHQKARGGIMVWGAISANGKLSLVIMNGKFSAAQYVQMLDEACLFIEGSQLCRQDFALQQDNAPIHTAWATTEYFHAMGINILHKWNWTNHKWNAEYCKSASRLHAFVSWTGARPVGMGLPQVAWVKLNCLQAGPTWTIPFVHAQMGSRSFTKL